jgi:cell division protein ZapA
MTNAPKNEPRNNEQRSDDPRQTTSVTVEIYDQTYHLRGHDPEYIQMLAGMVDSKMHAVAAQGTTVDSLRVAVLAALNVADELAILAEKYRVLSGAVNQTQSSIRSRASDLSGLLDSVLGDERRIG